MFVEHRNWRTQLRQELNVPPVGQSQYSTPTEWRSFRKSLSTNIQNSPTDVLLLSELFRSARKLCLMLLSIYS